MNYVGDLRKQKNGQEEDALFVDIVLFEFERFKRHLTSLLDRILLLTRTDANSNDKEDGFNRPESLKEEEEETATPRRRESRGGSNIDDETDQGCDESEWVSDVKRMMTILPRLTDEVSEDVKTVETFP